MLLKLRTEGCKSNFNTTVVIYRCSWKPRWKARWNWLFPGVGIFPLQLVLPGRHTLVQISNGSPEEQLLSGLDYSNIVRFQGLKYSCTLEFLEAKKRHEIISRKMLE